MANIDSFYTRSEKTDRKYTVGFALACAERRLKAIPNFRGGTCVNALRRREKTDQITLQQVNELADQIVADSLYYGMSDSAHFS
jgi:hypothetical protein